MSKYDFGSLATTTEKKSNYDFGGLAANVGKATNPTDGNSFAQNALIGIGSAFTDLGQGAGQLIRKATGDRLGDELGLPTESDVIEKRKIDQALMDTSGGKVGKFVGMALPAVIPGAQGLVGSVATGVALGALQPTAGEESRVENAVTSGVAGAAGFGAAKAIGAGVNAVRSMVKPFHEAGRQALAGQAVLNAAGTRADALKAVNALEGVAEIVPGSLPTAGQAAGNAGIAALERTAAAIDPATTNAIVQRAAQQNAARVAALEKIAGTGGARDAAAAARSEVGGELYRKAFDAGIDKAKLPEVKPLINDLLDNPYIEQNLAQAKMLARGAKVRIDGELTESLEGLHFLKLALDEDLQKGLNPMTAYGKTQLKQMAQTQDELLTVMDTLSPDYAAARAAFRDASKPVSEMDVAQALLDKAVNPLTENLTPSAYARALSDSTAARATGFKGSTLENSVSPESLVALRAVQEDLARSAAAQTAGRGPGSDTIQKLAYSDMLMNVPDFVRNFRPAQVAGNVGGRVLDTVYGRANKEIGATLAESLMTPKSTAGIIRRAMEDVDRSGAIRSTADTVAPYAGGLATTTGIIASQRR